MNGDSGTGMMRMIMTESVVAVNASQHNSFREAVRKSPWTPFHRFRDTAEEIGLKVLQ